MGSAKRRVFLDKFFECGCNATEAARQAGYKKPNVQGPRLKKILQPEIDARLDEMGMPANEVLARLSEQARADLADYITTGALLDWEKLKEHGKSRLIKKYRVTLNALGQMKTEIELYDAQRALELIGKAHGLFKDVQEQQGEVTVRVVYDND